MNAQQKQTLASLTRWKNGKQVLPQGTHSTVHIEAVYNRGYKCTFAGGGTVWVSFDRKGVGVCESGHKDCSRVWSKQALADLA